ncbi:DUF982 domain-containing protein [Pararhizobium sp.]|uniref:DUF982 domain-containing protein n=1 Tax=Pararhizobium sp. TaxID=1977563 RepID=UPI0027184798|nr:DUF982 domain-containing protein [Pararhizobium sp.]MDO9418592.1 DUF982 domain-containing protein [Pararhizobium sp.]
MIVLKPENCSALRWSHPVRIQLRPGSEEDILGPLQALNCLTTRWSKPPGPESARARQLCMAALGERVPCDVVKDAFVAAAEEAGLLVKS